MELVYVFQQICKSQINQLVSRRDFPNWQLCKAVNVEQGILPSPGFPPATYLSLKTTTNKLPTAMTEGNINKGFITL